MSKNRIDLFDEIFQYKKEYSGTIVEKHINKLKELDEFMPPMEAFFIVTNPTKQKYEFVSKNFTHALGLDKEMMTALGVPYWFSKFHEEDLVLFMDLLEDLMKYTVTEVSVDLRHKLSYTWNYRVKNSREAYVNIVEHLTPTYFDETGRPVMGVAHLTVVGKGESKPIIGSIKMLNAENEYETLRYVNYSQKLLPSTLSNREIDVVRLLAVNKTSKEIGNKLFISSHTVDGHRRNILKKLNFRKTQELVQYCMVNQFF